MANRHRGEISAVLNGELHTLVLTLGALAELEDAFGGEDILSVAEKLRSGRLSARQCVAIIGAGLRGAGQQIADDDVARMTTDGGVTGFVRIISELLTATFKPPVQQPAPTGPVAGPGK
ncbi:gene transfer agent family protein [Pyruvatibacter sp.]|uniref:gene transfer agent family protein n=1 Tax=Pyruvatibacter sp. TaxID=1981328 RepID=UPI0032EDC793